MVQEILRLLRPFRQPRITDAQWEALLRAMFEIIDPARRESSQLAREFFDSQWQAHRDDEAPRVDMPSYFRDYLAETLDPVRRSFQQADAPDSAIADIAELGMKEVESAGRRTVLRAVEETPEVLGWARVMTGRETCAFCTMLASRGPVYKSEASAGGDELHVFHKGCDCKVVPVFDRKSWPGRTEYKELAELWRTATAGHSGKNALNALRRYLADTENATPDASRSRAA